MELLEIFHAETQSSQRAQRKNKKLKNLKNRILNNHADLVSSLFSLTFYLLLSPFLPSVSSVPPCLRVKFLESLCE